MSAIPRLHPQDISWNFLIPFCIIHVACLGVFWTGVSAEPVIAGVVLYFLRIFGITAGYHRLYSHRSYHIPSKALRCVMWYLATSSAQRNVHWWASHHRHHHRKSDQEGDLHSPLQTNLLWSHVGWQYHKGAAAHDEQIVRDLNRTFPELATIDRFAWVSPLSLIALCSALWGWQGFVIAFCWSTVICWHVTFTINSLCHVWGTRPFETTDTSRNNMFLALLCLGEGWHNNHHAFQSSCRQGHTWWQIDISWMVLRLGQSLGLVTKMKTPPPRAMAMWQG